MAKRRRWGYVLRFPNGECWRLGNWHLHWAVGYQGEMVSTDSKRRQRFVVVKAWEVPANG